MAITPLPAAPSRSDTPENFANKANTFLAALPTMVDQINSGIIYVPNSGYQQQFPPGTVSVPSLSTTGDTNTGIYFPAADTVGIATGGTERAMITSTGNLLVGSTVDDGVNKLQVNGSSKATGYVQSIAAKTANYTLTSTDYTVTASGNITITLPAASSHTGRIFVVKKTDSNATVTTVDGTGSETIDGMLSYSLTGQYESITVQSNGTQWLII